MTLLVHWLQAVSALAWLGPAWLFGAPLWRTARGIGDTQDMRKGFGFFYAILQVGFSSRWFVWQHAMGAMEESELIAWGGLYGLSAMLAIAVVSIELRSRQ